MFKDVMKFWEDEQLKFCAQQWDVSATTAALEKAFSNKKKIEVVLTRLTALAGLLFLKLVHADGFLPRGRLNEGKKTDKEIFENGLAELSTLGLVYIMKNRARLDDSIDKVYVNEMVLSTLQKNRMVFIPDHDTHSLSFTQTGDIDAHSLFSLAGGVLPENLCDKFLDSDLSVQDGMLFLDGRFVHACASPVMQQEQGFDDEIFLPSLDGLYVISLLFLTIRKRVFRVSENNELRSRDCDFLAQSIGIEKGLLSELFSFLLMHSFLQIEDDIVFLSAQGRKWMSLDLDARFKMLSSLSYFVSFSDKYISLLSLYTNKYGPIELDCANDYSRMVNNIERTQKSLKLQWLIGLLSMHVDQGRVWGYSRNQVPFAESVVSGSLFVSGNMELHLFSEKLVAWQYFYLRAFCDINKTDKMIIAVINAETFRRGLLMGLDGKRFLTMLQDASEKGLPQNVVFSINDWIETKGKVVVAKRFLLHAEPEQVDLIMHDKQLSEYVEKKIDDMYLLLRYFDEREMIGLLEKYHIILDYEM